MKLKGLFKREEGVTLIELLVVVSIIGVLAGLVATGVTGSTTKSRATSYKEDKSRIQEAVQTYYGDSNINPRAFPTYTQLGTTSEFYVDFGYIVSNNTLIAIPPSASALNGNKGDALSGTVGSYGWIVDVTSGKVRSWPDFQEGRYP